MTNASGSLEAYEKNVKQRFLSLTGLNSVEIKIESAGPETFLRFTVGRDAPIYRWALTKINEELSPEDPLHGRLSLSVERIKKILYSIEVELLGSLISRSLRVTSDKAVDGSVVEFVPFRGGEERRAIQPANHAILGRRGVGKSSLILMAHHRIIRDGNVPVWLDLQAYAGRSDLGSILEVLREIFSESITAVQRNFPNTDIAQFESVVQNVNRCIGQRQTALTEEGIRELIPKITPKVREFTRKTGKKLYVFLDDAHLVDTGIQPVLFDVVYSVFKGGGGWVKVAGVKNLLRLYDPAKKVGLQAPHDVQLISLDLTLVDPAAARDHLTGVLQQFLEACRLRRSNEIIPNRAIDRLVWCSAGVPRDFLMLFERSIALAVQHRRRRVGVQEVNLAVGEFGQQKMSELEQDTGQEGVSLRGALERLQTAALDEKRSNSFLIRQDTNHEAYKMLQKLVDLRLVHLIHPSITPGAAGERYEAYLLDYSFYTGIRRRHGMSELKITANEPPKYAILRKLPKIDLDSISSNGA